MKAVYKGSCKWVRIKLMKHLYLNIKLLIPLPLIWITYDSRTIDEFFEYLIDDAMWDEVV